MCTPCARILLEYQSRTKPADAVKGKNYCLITQRESGQHSAEMKYNNPLLDTAKGRPLEPKRIWA